MRNRHKDHDSLPSRLKHLVVDLFSLDMLDPDQIPDEAPLLATLGLDSLDMLELSLCLEEEFGITIENREESESAFVSIASLTEFIQIRLKSATAQPRDSALTLFPGQAQSPLSSI